MGQGDENGVKGDISKDHKEKLDHISEPLALAVKFAETISHAKSAEFDLMIPELAQKWAEDVIQDYAFLIAEIAREAGMSSRIRDRDLYDASNPGSIDWNEGIRLTDILPYDGAIADADFWEGLEHHYQEIGYEPNVRWRFLKNEAPKNTLSGQYNRFFPVKLVMRVALNMLYSSDRYVVTVDDEEETVQNPIFLEDLRQECTKVARYVKERLQWYDSANGTNFGSWMSVGLTDGTKKQNERFVSQFVGSTRNPGKGLPFELGFLEVEDGYVKATESGVEFTLQTNPLIDDESKWSEGQTLSKNEQNLILRAIERNVPGEAKLMLDMLKWIEDGINTPNLIEDKMSEEMDLSPTEISLTRTGILARMQETGLVLREKSGRNVKYSKK